MKMVRRGRRGRAVLKTDVSLEAAAAAGILNGDDNNGDDNDLQQQQQHCASVGGVAYAAALNTQLHENHQHFASPKRKDCKMDKQVAVGTHDDATENAVPNGDLKMMKSSVATTPNRKTKGERNSGGGGGGGGAGKTIGVPLATRAQTRTIEIFFQAKAEQESAAAATQTQQTAKLYETKTEQTANANAVINLDSAAEDDNDDDEDASNGASEYSENTNTEQHEPHDFTSVNLNAYRDVSQASSFRSSTSDAENIFLQEPVLSLNVDKSPIHAACCVKINKSLDSEPIFSSPPSSLATSQLNGRFSQIVSLQGSPIVQELNCFDYKTMNGFSNNNNIVQQQPQQQQLQPPPQQPQQKLSTPLGQRERKPTTPHRIVVFGTSPIKTKSLHDNAATMTTSPSKRNAMHKELYYQSPRKSQRHTQAQVAVAAANITTTTTGTTNKTRRRLNQKGLELYLAANSTTTKANDVTTTTDITNNTTTTTTTTTKTNKLHCKIEPEVPTTLLNGHLEAANGPLKLEPHDEDEEFENLDQQQQPQAAATIKHELLNEQPPPKLTQNAPKQQQNKALKMKGGHAGGVGTQPLSLTNGNREMTEFFPVRRRSERKTKTAVKEEMMRDLEQAVLEERAEGMKVAYFEGKGRGIVADRLFKRGEFVVEYVGDLISIAEAGEREKRYALDENAGCYMYYFKHKTQQYCIDATVDTGKFGRLVNHSRNGNLLTKVVVVKQRPHLVLIAKEDIEPGEELTYDYGDRSKLSLLHHPWLAF